LKYLASFNWLVRLYAPDKLVHLNHTSAVPSVRSLFKHFLNYFIKVLFAGETIGIVYTMS